MRVALAASYALAAASVPAPFSVHEHSRAHRREAAWSRTRCGSPSKGADIVSVWGAAITPDTVKTAFAYPRPQMVRPDDTMLDLNGLWEFQLASAGEAPPFGLTLNQTILVPFPLESCLSGAFSWPAYSHFMFYRLLFDAPFGADKSTLLHFGAVDWNATVYLNSALIGNHSGGYDGFTFDLTPTLKAMGNELIVAVYDPSDEGYQPNGKQRISAIDHPGGDTYTPSSGIWQTVWLEAVPAFHIRKLSIRGDATSLHLSATTAPTTVGTLSVAVSFAGAQVATGSGALAGELVVTIPNPRLWSPQSPNLYDMVVSVTNAAGASDVVTSYFGLRTIGRINATQPPTPPSGPRKGYDNSGGDMPNQPTVLSSPDFNLCYAACNATPGCAAWSYGVPSCGGSGAQPLCWLKAEVEGWTQNECRIAGDQGTAGGLAQRPSINNNFTFLAGWLDQSWWPDGEYTAPGDDALRFDVQGVLDFGLNAVRLHQKVNAERWYYWADKLGVVVLQDMVQKYGGATKETVPAFMSDLAAMVEGRGNHPSIIQWTAFNEGDCFQVFDVPATVAWLQAKDPHRMVDTNSGGPANDLHIGDVNDIHSYPWPGNPSPSSTQYAMVGEFGGLGAFVSGHEWAPGECSTYLPTPTPQDEADTYVQMAAQLQANKVRVSVSVYTQLSDVENECDGFYSMDRTSKFTPAQVAEIVAANNALINGPA